MLPKNWGEPMGAPAIFEKQRYGIGIIRKNGSSLFEKPSRSPPLRSSS
ncbi:MAG: hypothetical protein P8X79_10035 [Reinekea sp.]